ncbi:hypothetical protein FRC11_013624 [Ceratobasidium sp. 423]|nr:hypothetical protein FRC11_013624 [Ceratobasidium sp. 423]
MLSSARYVAKLRPRRDLRRPRLFQPEQVEKGIEYNPYGRRRAEIQRNLRPRAGLKPPPRFPQPARAQKGIRLLSHRKRRTKTRRANAQADPPANSPPQVEGDDTVGSLVALKRPVTLPGDEHGEWCVHGHFGRWFTHQGPCKDFTQEEFNQAWVDFTTGTQDHTIRVEVAGPHGQVVRVLVEDRDMSEDATGPGWCGFHPPHDKLSFTHQGICKDVSGWERALFWEVAIAFHDTMLEIKTRGQEAARNSDYTHVSIQIKVEEPEVKVEPVND